MGPVTIPTMQQNSSLAQLPLRRRKGPGFYIRRDFFLYTLLALPIVYFILFKYVPMYGVVVAFKEFNPFKGILASPWIGLGAFKEIFGMKEFYRALKNTFILNGLDLLFGFPTPIILALLLNEVASRKYKRIANFFLYIPHFLSWVIIGGMVYQLFSTTNGLVNISLQSIGLQRIPFLSKGGAWIATYIGVGIWQNLGWGTIIYLAAISGINPELYEAAEVDGAGRFQKLLHVTLPGIKSTIIVLLVLNVGRMVLINFDRPFMLGNVMVMDNADVISTFVYRVGIQNSRYTIATAVGLFQSVIGLFFLLAADFVSRKSGERVIW
jgi:putative aldouronate transport system permease protein